MLMKTNALEPGYKDIGLYNASPIPSDIQWYQMVPRR
jgi:hypothetical protein